MNNVSVSMGISINNSADDQGLAGAELSVTKCACNLTRGKTYASGTGADQCDVIYDGVIAVTSLDTIDFNGVALKDGHGTGLAITKLKALYIKNNMGGAMEISNDGANIFPIFDAAADIIHIPDNGELYMTFPGAGLTIGAATGKIEITHAVGGAQNIEVVAVGVR